MNSNSGAKDPSNPLSATAPTGKSSAPNTPPTNGNQDTNGTLPPNNTNKPFEVSILEGNRLPVVVYGSENPSYLTVKKGDQHLWSSEFVEDKSIEDPGMVNLSFPIDAEKGMQFLNQEEVNKYGLYFAKIPSKQKITVCGTTDQPSCVPVDHREALVIKMSPRSFEQLFTDAQPFVEKNLPKKNWNLYFLGEDMTTFQSGVSSTLVITPENTAELNWNCALDIDEKVEFKTSGVELKTIQLGDKTILVGRFKQGDKVHNIIGVEKYEINTDIAS